MSWHAVDRPNVLGKRENMCWTCQKSMFGCSWSKDFVPVKGWDADPDSIKSTNGKALNVTITPTYKVYDCPEYVPEEGKEETA